VFPRVEIDDLDDFREQHGIFWGSGHARARGVPVVAKEMKSAVERKQDVERYLIVFELLAN